jgi:hypothetical protein
MGRMHMFTKPIGIFINPTTCASVMRWTASRIRSLEVPCEAEAPFITLPPISRRPRPRRWLDALNRPFPLGANAGLLTECPFR